MRSLLFLAVVCLLALGAIAKPSSKDAHDSSHKQLLGLKECTFGPSYWCQNLTTSAQCRATKHCIQTVWIHQKLDPDLSSVCQTCLEMVKEARDQLLSNETQEEIKEVFEGSCKLLPIKEISSECCKLADDFIPELVDTLASQMDPQVVCSVAGLCNNARVQQLLQESDAEFAKFQPAVNTRCDGCHTVMEIVDGKFRKASRDDVLSSFLQVCGRMSSLSDACSNIVITYFNDIYKHLQDNLNPIDFCLMAGECSAMFHNHASVEVTPYSKVGVVPVNEPDLPCDLCKQLVKHLKDILIANTTEAEFHQVLTGICKQTKSFKSECLNIVNEYYPMIYNFLVNELNGTTVCSMIQICPGPGLDQDAPIRPLLPAKTMQNLQGVVAIVPSPRRQVKTNSGLQELGPPELSQLPIERIIPQTLTLLGNSDLCEFCEYFLHFVQNAITDPKTEESIRQVIDGACEKLPGSLNETCVQFVNTYGPAFAAILAQDIDPSVICPKLSLCPSADLPNVEIFMNKGESGKCPLCLLALENLMEVIKNEKTEANIRAALGQLCSHLRGDIKNECVDFVETYTDEIIDGILANLTPEELCVYFKMCPAKKDSEVVPISQEPEMIAYGGEIETNEIPDYTHAGVQMKVGNQACVLCEFVMTQLKQELSENATESEIKAIVHSICHHLPGTIKNECDAFVNQYADMVIQLLLQSLEPSQICAEIKLCKPTKQIHQALELLDEVPVNSPQCSLCKLVMTQVEKILDGDITEDKVIKAIHDVCLAFPAHQKKECNKFIDKNGKRIVELLELAIQPSEICSLLMFCEKDVSTVKLEIRKCTICNSLVSIAEGILQNPNVDHSIEHVMEKSCRAFPENYQSMCKNLVDVYGETIFNALKFEDSRLICNDLGLCNENSSSSTKATLLGGDKCTWGPGYWCKDMKNAHECGALAHCQEKVWLSRTPAL